jgi:GNAT superfamily N-acetyltransferase
VSVLPATKEDLQALGTVINAAYEVETGDTGVAFKKTPRLLDFEELMPDLRAGQILKAVDAGGALVGCIVYQLYEDHLFFGPFAVAPELKGRGIGKALLSAVEAKARAAHAKYIEIRVINHRTDILPMYDAMGYVRVDEIPYFHPDRLTRPCNFIVMRRTLE